MGKKMLLGLGAVAGACFMVSKKMTEEQREKIGGLHGAAGHPGDLKDHLEETGKNLKDLADVETEDVESRYDEPEDDWNDDIVINGNTDSAFGEAKKAGDENATITFYPHKKD